MNDDDHRYGALRLSYNFEYAVMEQADKWKNTHFEFPTYDTYQWYLDVGPVANLNANYLHDSIPYWNANVEHPDYDDFWKREAWVRQLHASTVPNLNVAGFWDQEAPWGPWQIFRHAEEKDPGHTNFIVAGPWLHGQWQTAKAESIGLVGYGGHDTAKEFRAEIEAPFFRYYLHDRGDKFAWQAKTFQTGSNTWHTYAVWPPAGAKPTNLYLHADGTLAFEPPNAGATYRQYVSDPANPVPYRKRPISPTYPAGDWRTWEVDDQRFVDRRPDVLTYVSAPLEKDLVVTGEVAATLYASTSGSDSDFVVKLLDVYPEDAQKNAWEADAGPAPGQYAQSMNGYQLPIAMEVRRGRYLKSRRHRNPHLPGRLGLQVPFLAEDAPEIVQHAPLHAVVAFSQQKEAVHFFNRIGRSIGEVDGIRKEDRLAAAFPRRHEENHAPVMAAARIGIQWRPHHVSHLETRGEIQHRLQDFDRARQLSASRSGAEVPHRLGQSLRQCDALRQRDAHKHSNNERPVHEPPAFRVRWQPAPGNPTR
jgi:hypothetical protein